MGAVIVVVFVVVMVVKVVIAVVAIQFNSFQHLYFHHYMMICVHIYVINYININNYLQERKADITISLSLLITCYERRLL